MEPASTGVDGYIVALTRLGHPAELIDDLVVAPVEAAGGARHGEIIRVGVSCNELATWPATPPHWVHLPARVTFTHTNAAADGTLPGYLRHSRQVANWGRCADPAQAWVAQLRSILGEATG